MSLTGERKPSKIKAAPLTLADGSTRTIPCPKKDEPADPAVAPAAVRAAGYAVVGTRDGARHEPHVERDGRIRKAKPLAQPRGPA